METKNHINGEWITSKRTFRSICPEDGKVIGESSLASKVDVDKAVGAARAAFDKWRDTPVSERAQYVARAADILAKEYGNPGEATSLKNLIKREMGKRLPEADIEVIESSDMLRFFADQGPHCLADRPLALSRELWPTKKSTVGFQPRGVVAVIKPWNYPLELPLWSIGAALVAGNTVVFKPSEFSPFVAAKIVEIFEQAELPKGVLNMVTGDGTTGAALVEHLDIDMVSFTGSMSVGEEIAHKCVDRSCPVSLELGGKDAMIVLPDADMELAVNGALWGSFTNCGQVCVGVRRLLLSAEIKQDFTDLLVKAAKGLQPGRDIAPLASSQQLKKVQRHVQNAVQLGARALCGAKRPQDDAFEEGNFYLPTILLDTTPQMLVEKEDTFGPVVFIKAFSTEQEAIEIANSVHYDLGASVWTQNSQRGVGIAKRLNAGMVWLNDVNVAFPQAPWCGHRWSGHPTSLFFKAPKAHSRALHRQDRRRWSRPDPFFSRVHGELPRH